MYNHAPKNYICPFCLIAEGIENEHIMQYFYNVLP